MTLITGRGYQQVLKRKKKLQKISIPCFCFWLALGLGSYTTGDFNTGLTLASKRPLKHV